MSDCEAAHDGSKILVGSYNQSGEYAAFFEDDGETGYLYVWQPSEAKILHDLQIYRDSEVLGVEEDDVQVVWSQDGSKCSAVIWGGMRGVIDLANDREGRVFMESRKTPPIGDQEWLDGF